MASLSGSGIWYCHELLQMQLRSHIAVAVAQAGSCSSNSTPSLGTSLCHRCSPKRHTHTHKDCTFLNSKCNGPPFQMQHLELAIYHKN